MHSISIWWYRNRNSVHLVHSQSSFFWIAYVLNKTKSLITFIIEHWTQHFNISFNILMEIIFIYVFFLILFSFDIMFVSRFHSGVCEYITKQTTYTRTQNIMNKYQLPPNNIIKKQNKTKTTMSRSLSSNGLQ